MKIGVGPVWIEAKPFKKWAEKRARKRAEKTGQAVPVESGGSMLQGRLTYTGVAVLGLGWLLERFGVPVATDELEGAVAALVAAVGAIAAIYGRYRATKKVAG